MRPDLFDLVSRTVALGMRAVISTNGTLISQEIALRLKDLGLSYVGISLDGVEATHDRFRGKQRSSPRPWPGCAAARRWAEGGAAFHPEPGQLPGGAGHLRPGGGA